MFKVIAIITITICLAVVCGAQFDEGSGTEHDPWQIETAEHLNSIRDYTGDNESYYYFIQVADIDLDIAPFNQDEGWEPIMNFRGSYDGSTYIISGLMINRPETDDIGLFGLSDYAKISNVGLKDVQITGGQGVGGIVGRSSAYTYIDGCFVTGLITGNNYIGSIAGILVGSNPVSMVSNCYSTAVINHYGAPDGVLTIGGIVGQRQSGSILRNYFSGAIYSEQSSTLLTLGAILGSSRGVGSVANNYWNIDVAGVTRGGPSVGNGMTTTAMLHRTSYPNFSFNLYWNIVAGESLPFLQWEGNTPGEHNQPPLLPPKRLTATAGVSSADLSWEAPDEHTDEPDGYNIYRRIAGEISLSRINEEIVTDTLYHDSDLNDFTSYQYQVSAVYGEYESLMSNFAGAYPYSFAGGEGTEEEPFLVETANHLHVVRFHPDSHFLQIADIDLGVPPWNEEQGWEPIRNFHGTYDGNGSKILHLTHSLFINIRNASIRNIALHKVELSEKSGALAVRIENSNVVGCYVSGDSIFERGWYYCGGFAGESTGSTFTNCYSNVNLLYQHNTSRAGGMIGRGVNTIITNCYVNGYFSGNVNPFFGNNWGHNTITNSYWNVEMSGLPDNETEGGRTALELTQMDTFVNWDFDEVWSIGYNGTATYPYLQINRTPTERNIPAVPPQGYAYTEGDARNILIWESPSIGEPERYHIYRNGEYLVSVDPDTEGYADSGLQNYTSYNYYLTAVYGDRVSTPSTISSATPVPGGYSVGKGRADDPYQIRFAQQLDNVRYNPYSHFIQTQDIDLSEFDSWVGIGSSYDYFSGSFDGNGFIIENLTISHTVPGLFGFTADAVLKNISIHNANINSLGDIVGVLVSRAHFTTIANCSGVGSVTGNDSVGGLIGRASGSIIDNCFSSGMVSGQSDNVGGLVADARQSVIRNSYSTCSVSGTNYVGGLVGNSAYSHIIHCYSAGNVEGRGDAAGGLIGSNTESMVQASFWDIETSRQRESAGGLGMLTAQMVNSNNYTDWDFDSIWTCLENVSYPAFQWQELNSYSLPGPSGLIGQTGNVYISLQWLPTHNQTVRYNLYRDGRLYDGLNLTNNAFIDEDISIWQFYTYYVTAVMEIEGEMLETARSNSLRLSAVDYAGGNGTQDDPYLISNAYQLAHLHYAPNSVFMQANDISLNEYPWNQGVGWLPVGSNDLPYSATYDGNGFHINGLMINSPNASYAGLFGVTTNAVMRNISLLNVNVSGSNLVGAVAGLLDAGQVINCSVTGMVNGQSYIGGIVGRMINASIERCFSNVTVSGNYQVGGIAGLITDGSLISDSYSRGGVIANNVGGGLAGQNSDSLIRNCYSISRVNTATGTGGLVGRHLSGVVVNSYWDRERSGINVSAQGNPCTTAQMTYPHSGNTYFQWDFNEVWTADTDHSINEGYPYLRQSNYLTVDDNEPGVISKSILIGNYPNPFNPETTISFSLAEAGEVLLEVFNIKGQKVATIVAERLDKGDHQVLWDGRDDNRRQVGSGVYFYRMTSGSYTSTKKMIMLR